MYVIYNSLIVTIDSLLECWKFPIAQDGAGGVLTLSTPKTGEMNGQDPSMPKSSKIIG